MKLTMTFLLGLATVASAIEIRFYGNNGCSGRFNSCWNVNPNQCCNQAEMNSISFEFIPSNWRITVKGYDQNACNRQKAQLNTVGQTRMCIGGDAPYTGGGYNFYGRKRDDDHSNVEAAPSSECLRPDIFADEDGVEYSAQSLNDDEFEKLVALWYNGTSVSDVVSTFSSFTLKE
ncbi:hypothetical protein ONS95_011475 [Cadophora gregata]|uniref:uncharacterized protein n=1 Tax=Cadophora gregata TaxID=51156 RepID=UPI0026DD0515|nr:uncharacterized protein ONS95_011475 [Cadophora gregata]KAK0120062.1 hypothetical protein ONS95_011475 [Cadophora gregata]KAK0121094.1 hypothetical protein ONS96_011276 [Cadophora gregata f. sp. sojae]